MCRDQESPGVYGSKRLRTVRRERAHVPLSLLAPVHRRLSQPLKVSAKTHNVYFSRHGYDRPAFATLGRRQAAGSAAVDSSSPRPLAAAFRQDSDLPPSSPLSIRDPHVLPACDESECFPRSGLRARATGTIHPLCPRVLRGGPPGIRRATRYPLLRAFAPLLPVTFRQTNIYKMAPRSRKATAARRAVLAAALLATTASAQTFRRTAACPTLGCIFPLPSRPSLQAKSSTSVSRRRLPRMDRCRSTTASSSASRNSGSAARTRSCRRSPTFSRWTTSSLTRTTLRTTRCAFASFALLSSLRPSPCCRAMSSPLFRILDYTPAIIFASTTSEATTSARIENVKIQLSDGLHSLPRTSLPRTQRHRLL